jgi:hypothetical protein
VSDTGSKKIKDGKKAGSKKLGSKSLWEGIIEYDEPSPSAEMESLRAAIDVGLEKFEQQKTTMISMLRDARDGRLGPFDETKSWSRLTSLAHSFFWQAELKLKFKTPAANRRRRLDELARVLKRSRTIIDASMQDDVGDLLFSSWCEGINEPFVSVIRNLDGSLSDVRPPEEMFKKAVASLGLLEAAARDAARAVKLPGRGRKLGTAVLPAGYIEVLATLYCEATGAKAGVGLGPFVRFVCAFLTAVGSASISEDYVAELAQAALSSARAHPGASAPYPD